MLLSVRITSHLWVLSEHQTSTDYFTCKVRMAVWDNAPLLAMTVTVYAPGGEPLVYGTAIVIGPLVDLMFFASPE